MVQRRVCKLRKLKVLHILGTLNRGGAETLVMNLFRSVDNRQVQFDFMIHTKKNCDYTGEILLNKGSIYSVPSYKGYNHSLYVKAIAEVFSKEAYDIIHCHVRSTAAIMINIAHSYGIKAISHSHSVSSGRGIRGLIKLLYQFPIRYTADYFLACSQEAGQWLYGKRVCNSDKFYILKNGIPVDKFAFDNEKRVRVRKSLNIENTTVIGNVGSFEYPKNHKRIFELFCEYLNVNKEAVLLLIGDGSEKLAIMDKVMQNKLINKVFFIGNISDISPYLCAMDVFLFPSHYEGLGIAVIEAQANGLPCIVSTGLPKEVGVTELVDFVDLQKENSEWIKAMCNVSKTDRMAYAEILKYAGFDIEDTGRQLIKIYLKIIDNISKRNENG